MRSVVLALALVLTLAACSTEAAMREAARAERASLEDATVGPEVNKRPKARGLEGEVQAATEALEAQRERLGHLPADLALFVESKLNHAYVQRATWDGADYNLCLFDPRSGRTALVQSQHGTSYGDTIRHCRSEIPTEARETHRNLTSALNSILNPVINGLAFRVKTFDRSLARAVRARPFGEVRVRAGEGSVRVGPTYRGLKAVRTQGGERAALVFACTSVNGLALRRVATAAPSGFNVSEQFIRPEECRRDKLQHWAWAWWMDGRM